MEAEWAAETAKKRAAAEAAAAWTREDEGIMGTMVVIIHDKDRAP